MTHSAKQHEENTSELKAEIKTDKYSCVYEYENPDNYCDTCECVLCNRGRSLEEVNEYASTCDNCGELTHHQEMEMDNKTQLGYCEKCTKHGTPENHKPETEGG